MAADLFEVIETGAGAPQQLYGVEDGSHRFCGGCRFKYLRGRKQEGDWELKDACACVSCDRCCGRSRREVLWRVQMPATVHSVNGFLCVELSAELGSQHQQLGQCCLALHGAPQCSF